MNSSEASPVAEHCRFCVLQPSVSILSTSPGRVRTKVQGSRSDVTTLSQVWRGRPTGLFHFSRDPRS